MTGMEYYSLKPVLSRGAELNFIIGARSAGKTYAYKEWALKDFIKNGNESVYVRRTEEELIASKNTLWDDIAWKFGMEVKSKGSNALIRPTPPDDIFDKELKQWSSETPWKQLGYYIPLSESQSFKSASFPKVNKIGFDEFIIENTRRRYIPGEVDMLLGLIFTIGRDRKIKTVCLSNSGFISNPYFHYYDVKSSDFENNSFVKRNKGAVIFEMYNNEKNNEIMRETSIARISNDNFKDYAIENKFKDGGEELVGSFSTASKPILNVTVDGKDWLCVYSNKSDGFYIKEGKSKHARSISLDKWRKVTDAQYISSVNSMLKEALNYNSISFSDADIREKFITWLRIS